MEFIFYICSLIAILTTLRIVTHTNPMYALIYLIISLLAISGVFFSLGAYFPGAMEIIVYAGAVIVLFVFIIMILNLDSLEVKQEYQCFRIKIWIGPSILSTMILSVIVYAIMDIDSNQVINNTPVLTKEIGITLFGPYVLAVELASMLLLAGLVVAFHIGNEERTDKMTSYQISGSVEKIGERT